MMLHIQYCSDGLKNCHLTNTVEIKVFKPWLVLEMDRPCLINRREMQYSETIEPVLCTISCGRVVNQVQS
jgi:hypothetical protein